MRVRVDPLRCQGHTLCALKAPAVFDLDDLDGHASARFEVVPDDQQASVRVAAANCPEQAIVVSE